MMKSKKFLMRLTSLVFTASLFFLMGCGNDDDDITAGPTPTANVKTYALNSIAGSGVSGDATFTELSDGSVQLVLELSGTEAGNSHPAHIHANTAAEGGAIAISLMPVDGANGISTTIIDQQDDGSAITYVDLLAYDGYINVHLSADELGTIVAQGDIGQNELTGETIEYDLEERAVAGISGSATFYERVNGEALAVLSLVNTPDGGSHPAHIHANSASEGGAIIFSFNPVDGTSGISRTNVAMLDDGSSLVYSDIESINGYINVHQSADELGTIVAQGNIGINVGSSSNSTNYDVTNSGASAYVFNDSGFTNEQNPNITLQRGMTYTFTVNATGHPFFIKTAQSTGTGDAYNAGVTNNGSQSGTITFTVPSDAPNTLFYICEFHSSMTGTITITD